LTAREINEFRICKRQDPLDVAKIEGIAICGLGLIDRVEVVHLESSVDPVEEGM
jgi:hypothetical protein